MAEAGPEAHQVLQVVAGALGVPDNGTDRHDNIGQGLETVE